MNWKKVYFTTSAKRQIQKHEELSMEEIESWLNDRVREKYKTKDGYCLIKIIYRKDYSGRPKKHQVNVYYREKRTKFEVYNIHKGRLGEDILTFKKK